ncbi:uncharacterized protein LOC142328245 isoform X2 [Lycorma delicatula]|uniref:uncharacterized protein LOC142328245 isoform X2 n=1 Tax=Lycorma delicatula TaxID=130591 RepID=UPI003F517DE8
MSHSFTIPSFSFLSSYTSCIKIAGQPILPPLITDERKKELIKYKADAKSVERRLLEKHKKQQHKLQHSKSVDFNSSFDSSTVITRSVDCNKENESLTTFYLSESQSDITTLASSTDSSSDKNGVPLQLKSLQNITKSSHSVLINDDDDDDNNNKSNTNENLNTVFSKESVQDVDCEQSIQFPKKSVEDIDSDEYSASHYNNSVLGLLPDSKIDNISNCNNSLNILKCKQQHLNLSPCKDLVLKSDIFLAMNNGKVTIRGEAINSESPVFYKISDVLKHSNDFNKINESNNNILTVYERGDCITNDSNKCKQEELKSKTPVLLKTPPKLVRQNSYTLDSPSPELVAYLEKQQTKDKKKPGMLKRTHTWTVASEEDDSSKEFSTDFKPFSESNNDHVKKARKAWNLEEAKQKWQDRLNNSQVVNVNSTGPNRLHKSNNEVVQPVSVSTDCRLNTVQSIIHSSSTDCVFSLTNNSSILNNSCDSKSKRSDKTISPLLPRCDPINYNLHELENSLDINLKLSDVRNTSLSTMTLTPEKDTTCGSSVTPISNNKSSSDRIDVPYSSCSINAGDYVTKNLSLQNTVNDDTMSTCSSISLSKSMLSRFDHADKALQQDQNPIYADLRSHHYKQIEELLRKQEEELQMLLSSSSRPQTTLSRQTSSPPIISNYSHSNHAVTLSIPPDRMPSDLSSRTKTPCSRRLFYGTAVDKRRKCPLEYTEKERVVVYQWECHKWHFD